MRFLIFSSIIIVCLHGCKSKETIIPNRPPNSFNVTPTLKNDGKTIILNWSKAIDPDGDAISYTIVLKDTIAKNIRDTIYTINSLDYNYSQIGKVIAIDPKGLTSEATFTATTKTIVPNRPPNSFTVTPTLKSDGKTIILNWTKALDPDGDLILYTIVLQDTLIKNIKDTTFTINSLNFNYNQIGKVIAKDSAGLTSEAKFTAITKTVVYANIPDPNFEKHLVEEKIDKDGTVNGKINPEDVKWITNLRLDNKNIKDLTGIELFTDIKILWCSNNPLTTLDLSNNTNLVLLFCEYNKINNLNVSKNLQLVDLYCDSNELTTLNVSKNLNLKTISCTENQLKTLDVSQNISLQNLHCSKNPLNVVNVDKNINLTTLWCRNNSLISLDISKNTNLQELDCAENQLSKLDISSNLKLLKLSCNNNLLSNLDISRNLNLTEIDCNNNKLAVLDLNKALNLTRLSCRSNLLTNLDISKNVSLKNLDCSINKLGILDVSKNTNLQRLWCYYNFLRTLDISSNISLQNLNCENNELSNLELSKNTNLEWLYCRVNKLTTLDVRKNSKLHYLNCLTNSIKIICVNSLSQPTKDWYKDAIATYTVCQ